MLLKFSEFLAHENPTKSQLKSLLTKGLLRGIVYDYGSRPAFIVWNAYDATHTIATIELSLLRPEYEHKGNFVVSNAELFEDAWVQYQTYRADGFFVKCYPENTIENLKAFRAFGNL